MQCLKHQQGVSICEDQRETTFYFPLIFADYVSYLLVAKCTCSDRADLNLSVLRAFIQANSKSRCFKKTNPRYLRKGMFKTSTGCFNLRDQRAIKK